MCLIGTLEIPRDSPRNSIRGTHVSSLGYNLISGVYQLRSGNSGFTYGENVTSNHYRDHNILFPNFEVFGDLWNRIPLVKS